MAPVLTRQNSIRVQGIFFGAADSATLTYDGWFPRLNWNQLKDLKDEMIFRDF